jgi:hypothetical protein
MGNGFRLTGVKQRNPAITAPTNDTESHTKILQQLKESVEVAQRLRGNPDDSFVRVRELNELGISRSPGGQLVPAPGQSNVQYLFTETAVTHFGKSQFVHGITIIGVRFAGAATVYIPADLDNDMLVSIKDEAGTASITIIPE